MYYIFVFNSTIYIIRPINLCSVKLCYLTDLYVTISVKSLLDNGPLCVKFFSLSHFIIFDKFLVKCQQNTRCYPWAMVLFNLSNNRENIHEALISHRSTSLDPSNSEITEFHCNTFAVI